MLTFCVFVLVAASAWWKLHKQEFAEWCFFVACISRAKQQNFLKNVILLCAELDVTAYVCVSKRRHFSRARMHIYIPINPGTTYTLAYIHICIHIISCTPVCQLCSFVIKATDMPFQRPIDAIQTERTNEAQSARRCCTYMLHR